MTIDVERFLERYATTKATVVSGTLVPSQATWLDEEVFPSLEEASRAARNNPRHAGKVIHMILHLPGGVDEILDHDQMRALLAPRPEYSSTAVRSGLRQARDVIEMLPRKFTQITAEMQSINRVGGGSYYRSLRDSSVEAYREAGRSLIAMLVAVKGDRAKNRQGELALALEELSNRVQREFLEHVSSPLHSKPALEIARLADDLARAQSRMLLDFEEGVFHAMADKSQDHSINIGSIGQMAGHIGTGNSGSVRADQSWNDGAVFDRLAAAIQSGVSNEADRTALLTSVEEMRDAGDDGTLYARAYGAFLSRASVYMTIFGPFIPALGQILQRASGAG